MFGSDHLDVAMTRENMATIYWKQGHYDQALEIYKSVLETKIRVCGHEHPDVATSFNNIGSVYNSQGKYEEALEVYTKSLDIKTRIYGGDNHGGPGRKL